MCSPCSTPVDLTAPMKTDTALDPRTRALLHAPLLPLLLRMAGPNVLVMLAQAAAGLIETWFVGRLGTDALAGMSLVFPVVMLMQTTSGGALGGAIASAVARALGRGRRDEADALAWHAVVIALVLGGTFAVALSFGGRALYAAMGGQGAALDAALVYSGLLFSGAMLVWLFNALAAVIRGAGNMVVPARVVMVGTVMLVPVSPVLILGLGSWSGLGIAGGAVALLLYYLGGTLALLAYLRSRHSLLRLQRARLRADWFIEILRVGLAGTVSTVATNLSIAIATGLAGRFGAGAIAGYGTGSRLEYLLIPLVFGLGAPLVTLVGTCVGAGQHKRALRAAWLGAGLAFALTETIGLVAALWPQVWLGAFGHDPALLQTGTVYLHAVGPVYGFFGLGLCLYFASQGAGRLFWPMMGNVVRLVLAAGGGLLAWALWGATDAGLAGVFAAQALALAVYGLFNAVAVASGAWSRKGR